MTVKDLWSNSKEYRSKFQADDEVRTVLDLLDLKDARRLVDVGCGNGAFSLAASRAFPHLNVFAYDALDSAIAAFDTAAADLPRQRITSAVAPAENIPLPAASADRILCRAVLHHITDPQHLYHEFARLLTPGGQLLLQAPCNPWQLPWSQFIAEFFHLMDDSHPRQYHTPSQIITGLSTAGLQLQRADSWPFTFHDVSESQRALIAKTDAADRVKLRQESDGRWAVDLYWIRILSRKT
jgi:SAM-dependent methyltransferase